MAPEVVRSSPTTVVAVGTKRDPSKPASSPPSRDPRPPPAPAASNPARNDVQSDRDSDSSALSDVGDLEVDSEAETERVDNSPQKPRTAVVYKHGNSSISSAAADRLAADGRRMPVPADRRQEDRVELRSASPTPRSPTKKRKRNPHDGSNGQSARHSSTEPSVTPPPKKKSYQNGDDGAKDASVKDRKVQSMTNGLSGSSNIKFARNGADGPSSRPTEDEKNAEQSESSKESLGSHDHSPTECPGDDGEEHPALPPPEGDMVDVSGDHAHEDEPDSRDLKKKQAQLDLTEIENLFAKLKDSIFAEKLRRVELEMKLLEEGQHPEYLSQKHSIDRRLEEKIRLANAQFKHGMQSLDKSTFVHKAQIHSQYFQRTREIRENALYLCSEKVFHIQRECRSGLALVPEYTYRIPDTETARMNQRRQYNWEVGILAGVAKYHGFPAAPDVTGASEEEMNEDLEAMGIQRAPVRAIAPVAVPRIETQYKRASPAWPQQQSPPSPVNQPHPHAHAHVHRHQHPHHHHHHRPSQPAHAVGAAAARPEPAYGGAPRRTTSALGPQPPQVPLSTLIQGSEGAIKMEPQLSSQSLSRMKNSDSYPTAIQGPLFQQPTPRPSLFQSLAHLSQQSAEPPPPRIRSPTPGERLFARDGELDSIRRLKEESGEGSGLAGPLAGLSVQQRFGAAAGRSGYS